MPTNSQKRRTFIGCVFNYILHFIPESFCANASDITGAIKVGDQVLRVEGKKVASCVQSSLSPFLGHIGTTVKIELQAFDVGSFVVDLTRQTACYLGSSAKCGFLSGTSISLAHLADTKGAAEILCLTVAVRTSADEVMLESITQGRHHMLSTGCHII